jgi:hypothetical protein
VCEGGLIVVEKNSTDRGAGVAYSHSAVWVTCARYFESDWTFKTQCVTTHGSPYVQLCTFSIQIISHSKMECQSISNLIKFI